MNKFMNLSFVSILSIFRCDSFHLFETFDQKDTLKNDHLFKDDQKMEGRIL